MNGVFTKVQEKEPPQGKRVTLLSTVSDVRVRTTRYQLNVLSTPEAGVCRHPCS